MNITNAPINTLPLFFAPLVDGEWNSTMPWQPAMAMALETRIVNVSEVHARRVASLWHPGMWSALYSFASTGEIIDPRSLAMELEECLIEAGDVDEHNTEIKRLAAFIYSATSVR